MDNKTDDTYTDNLDNRQGCRRVGGRWLLRRSARVHQGNLRGRVAGGPGVPHDDLMQSGGHIRVYCGHVAPVYREPSGVFDSGRVPCDPVLFYAGVSELSVEDWEGKGEDIDFLLLFPVGVSYDSANRE